MPRGIISLISKKALPEALAVVMKSVEQGGLTVTFNTGLYHHTGALKLKNGTLVTLNVDGDLSYTNPKQNGLVVPLFIEGLEKVRFFPHNYTPTPAEEITGYALTEIAARNAGVFQEGKFQEFHYSDIYKMQTLLRYAKANMDHKRPDNAKYYETQANMIARMIGLPDRLKSSVFGDPLTLSGANYDPSEIVRRTINTKGYTAISQLTPEERQGLNDGALSRILVHKHENMAVSIHIGKAVRELWCNTVGVCDAEARVGPAFGLGVRFGGKLAKPVLGTSVLGVAGLNLLNSDRLPEDYKPVTRWIVEDIIPSPIRIFSTPIEDMLAKVSILQAFGPEVSKPIFDNPASLRYAIKLLSEAQKPTQADKEIEIVDAVGGQQIDPGHEPDDDQGDDFHKKAHEDIKPFRDKIVKTDDALDKAIKFLGKGYKDMGNGRFVSADKLRQIRMDDPDILGHHYKGPHINFDILKPNPIRPNKMIVIDKIHMLLK